MLHPRGRTVLMNSCLVKPCAKELVLHTRKAEVEEHRLSLVVQNLMKLPQPGIWRLIK